jgi:hypothetical protein
VRSASVNFHELLLQDHCLFRVLHGAMSAGIRAEPDPPTAVVLARWMIFRLVIDRFFHAARRSSAISRRDPGIGAEVRRRADAGDPMELSSCKFALLLAASDVERAIPNSQASARRMELGAYVVLHPCASRFRADCSLRTSGFPIATYCCCGLADASAARTGSVLGPGLSIS